jgi:hypothetical protein
MEPAAKKHEKSERFFSALRIEAADKVHLNPGPPNLLLIICPRSFHPLFLTLLFLASVAAQLATSWPPHHNQGVFGDERQQCLNPQLRAPPIPRTLQTPVQLRMTEIPLHYRPLTILLLPLALP